VTAGTVPRPDLATVIARFSNELRHAGMPVSSGESAVFARALDIAQPTTVADLYWLARVSMLHSVDLLPIFDRVFAMVFRGLADPAEVRGDTSAPAPIESAAARSSSPVEDAAPSGTMIATEAENAASSDVGLVMSRMLASSSERLTEADFATLTPEELRALAPLLQSMLRVLPERQTRRRRRHPHGDRMDVRATLRRSSRSGGDPVRAIRRNRVRRPRRLVALLDISGSMEPYARAYLHLLWGAAAYANAEVFVFGTRLTRLTRALRIGQPEAALDRAARMMPDWSGGTRIGHAMKAFLDGYGRRGLAHGAVVLIVSDGWEREDPAVLRSQIEALSRRTYRLVWANPRAAAPGFEPSTGGMSAVLPYLDDLVSGHSAAAMAAMVRALGDARVSVGHRPPCGG
jgi:uncharacterized protein with von Willebrand factor type A (vWA) domain